MVILTKLLKRPLAQDFEGRYFLLTDLMDSIKTSDFKNLIFHFHGKIKAIYQEPKLALSNEPSIPLNLLVNTDSGCFTKNLFLTVYDPKFYNYRLKIGSYVNVRVKLSSRKANGTWFNNMEVIEVNGNKLKHYIEVNNRKRHPIHLYGMAGSALDYNYAKKKWESFTEKAYEQRYYHFTDRNAVTDDNGNTLFKVRLVPVHEGGESLLSKEDLDNIDDANPQGRENMPLIGVVTDNRGYPVDVNGKVLIEENVNPENLDLIRESGIYNMVSLPSPVSTGARQELKYYEDGRFNAEWVKQATEEFKATRLELIDMVMEGHGILLNIVGKSQGIKADKSLEGITAKTAPLHELGYGDPMQWTYRVTGDSNSGRIRGSGKFQMKFVPGQMFAVDPSGRIINFISRTLNESERDVIMHILSKVAEDLKINPKTTSVTTHHTYNAAIHTLLGYSSTIKYRKGIPYFQLPNGNTYTLTNPTDLQKLSEDLLQQRHQVSLQNIENAPHGTHFSLYLDSEGNLQEKHWNSYVKYLTSPETQALIGKMPEKGDPDDMSSPPPRVNVYLQLDLKTSNADFRENLHKPFNTAIPRKYQDRSAAIKDNSEAKDLSKKSTKEAPKKKTKEKKSSTKKSETLAKNLTELHKDYVGEKGVFNVTFKGTEYTVPVKIVEDSDGNIRWEFDHTHMPLEVFQEADDDFYFSGKHSKLFKNEDFTNIFLDYYQKKYNIATPDLVPGDYASKTAEVKRAVKIAALNIMNKDAFSEKTLLDKINKGDITDVFWKSEQEVESDLGKVEEVPTATEVKETPTETEQSTPEVTMKVGKSEQTYRKNEEGQWYNTKDPSKILTGESFIKRLENKLEDEATAEEIPPKVEDEVKPSNEQLSRIERAIRESREEDKKSDESDGEDYSDLFSSDRILLREDYILENISHARKWMKENLPQVPFSIVQGLIDNKSFGRVTKNGLLLSNIAEEGTIYHEAFHSVTHYLFTKGQRQSVYNEFRDRMQGEYVFDREGTPHKITEETSNEFIEEYLAEEFREYILTINGSQFMPINKINYFMISGESIKNAILL